MTGEGAARRRRSAPPLSPAALAPRLPASHLLSAVPLSAAGAAASLGRLPDREVGPAARELPLLGADAAGVLVRRPVAGPDLHRHAVLDDGSVQVVRRLANLQLAAAVDAVARADLAAAGRRGGGDRTVRGGWADQV